VALLALGKTPSAAATSSRASKPPWEHRKTRKDASSTPDQVVCHSLPTQATTDMSSTVHHSSRKEHGVATKGNARWTTLSLTTCPWSVRNSGATLFGKPRICRSIRNASSLPSSSWMKSQPPTPTRSKLLA